MKKTRISGITFAAIVSLTALLLCGMAIAQSAEVQGVIDGRSGATMTVKSDSGNVIVLLTDSTDVQEVKEADADNPALREAKADYEKLK
jgi:hypothetical protein